MSEACYSPQQSFDNYLAYVFACSSIFSATFAIFIVLTRSPAMMKSYRLILIQYLIWSTIFSLSCTFNGRFIFYNEYMIYFKKPFMDNFPISLRVSYVILWVPGSALQTSIVSLFECRHHEALPAGHCLKLKSRIRKAFRILVFTYFLLSGAPPLFVGDLPTDAFLKDFPEERCNMEHNRIRMISLEGWGFLHINLIIVTLSCGIMIAAFAYHTYIVLNRYNLLWAADALKTLQRGYLKSLVIMELRLDREPIQPRQSTQNQPS
ncbi:unnamed protein product [Caenorhabditis auriculariae]|uniref:Uncharacterized protein n=1 Tax=Caenorhabditis auriculariae TaxID=2777116 RepID=A0A8S1HS16_9PELO|nr:unnamed protein product [Caenorhabditis auriculariae]